MGRGPSVFQGSGRPRVGRAHALALRYTIAALQAAQQTGRRGIHMVRQRSFKYVPHHHSAESLSHFVGGYPPSLFHEGNFYDADGKRRLKARDVYGEVDLEGDASFYFYEGEDLICQLDRGAEMQEPEAYAPRFLLLDHLGTTRAELQFVADGATQQPVINATYDYMPYGDILSEWHTGVNPPGEQVLFTGKQRDTESGLDYFGARFYANSLLRWTSPDQPFVDNRVEDPLSWNLYNYVRSNTLKYIDINGFEITKSDNVDSAESIVYVFISFQEPQREQEVLLETGETTTIPAPDFDKLTKMNSNQVGVVVYTGKDVSLENYTLALKDTKASSVMFIGHSQGLSEESRFSATGINLADSPDAISPIFTDINSKNVANFSCDSINFRFSYFMSGEQSYVGLNSGSDGYTTTSALSRAGFNYARSIINGEGIKSAISSANWGFDARTRYKGQLVNWGRALWDVGDRVQRF